jgi:hypothetical protein
LRHVITRGQPDSDITMAGLISHPWLSKMNK